MAVDLNQTLERLESYRDEVVELTNAVRNHIESGDAGADLDRLAELYNGFRDESRPDVMAQVCDDLERYIHWGE